MIALRPPFCGMGLLDVYSMLRAKIRRWLVGVAALVAFWMLVVLLKYPIRGRFGYRPAVVLLLHSHDGDPNVVRAVRDARRLAR